jgi:transketolase
MINDLEPVADFARRIRCHALRMVHRVNASHIGSCLSIADLLAVLYTQVLRVQPDAPAWPDRDRFILSKGHATAILYAALAERGFFAPSWLEAYCQDGSPLAGHVSHYGVPGVEVSTGSLGHGLPLACGMALAGRAAATPFRVYAILSDGECDEGSTWEGALFAPQHRLDNLTVIVDHNKLQGFGATRDVLTLEPFAEKWRAFGWDTLEIDGHDLGAIVSALRPRPHPERRPLAVIAHTVKGKGVSYMENQLAWHYKSPNPEQLTIALAEIQGS